MMDWGKRLERAQQIVEGKLLFKRWIDGTPLANDIAVWMADFAGEIAAKEREACAKVAEHFGAVKHGAIATDPVAVQQQSSREIAAAIRADQHDARSDAP